MAGIYLHVPFCHAKCAYCDFYSTARTDRVADYSTAVVNEYHSRIAELAGLPIETLYFGGGTPSILPDEIFTKLADTLYLPTVREFTVEANPEDITLEKVHKWRAAGVNRVSIGVQSLVDTELRAIRRRHSAGEALDAIAKIIKGGITNISADLIYGLPGQTTESWEYSVSTLLDSGISHLSAYCLSYEPGTLLTRSLLNGEITETDEETELAMYRALCRQAATAGFEHYEISNFARPGYRSRHNSSYWESIPYLGLGPGAHSLSADMQRRFNPSDIRTYISEKGMTATLDEESDYDRINNTIMVRLRTAAGLDLSLLPDKYLSVIEDSAKPWIANGNLVLTNNILHIPEDSWLVSDAIIRDLFVTEP